MFAAANCLGSAIRSAEGPLEALLELETIRVEGARVVGAVIFSSSASRSTVRDCGWASYRSGGEITTNAWPGASVGFRKTLRRLRVKGHAVTGLQPNQTIRKVDFQRARDDDDALLTNVSHWLGGALLTGRKGHPEDGHPPAYVRAEDLACDGASRIVDDSAIGGTHDTVVTTLLDEEREDRNAESPRQGDAASRWRASRCHARSGSPGCG